jgi:ribonuclease PH
MADKGEELVQYITEKVVHYMETPKETRKQNRQLRHPKEAWLNRWFGVVPFALSMWLEQQRKKFKRRKTKS